MYRHNLSVPSRNPSGCDGGWYRNFDTDYPCSGCARCRRDALPLAMLGAWIWFMARTQARAEAGALIALARIGQAIAVAGAPGLGVGRFVRGAVEAYAVIRKGSYVRVVGKRGRNPAPMGTEGEVFWLGQTGQYNTWRAGIRDANGETFWSTLGNLMVIVPPQAVREAAAEREAAYQAKRAAEREALLAKPEANAGRGDQVRVTAGKAAGAVGEVFWVGPSKDGSGNRCGLRTADGATVWTSLREVEVVFKAPKKGKGKKAKPAFAY